MRIMQTSATHMPRNHDKACIRLKSWDQAEDDDPVRFAVKDNIVTVGLAVLFACIGQLFVEYGSHAQHDEHSMIYPNLYYHCY
jgi:hypothetical protein